MQKARQSLLRCYFDSGDSANVRATLDQFSDDVSVPFSFGRVLLECIALMLEEEDASEELVAAAIEKGIVAVLMTPALILTVICSSIANAANPYAIWVFAYYEIFDSAVEYLEEIMDPELGSVEEALMSALGTATSKVMLCNIFLIQNCFPPTDDIELWESVEGALDALSAFIEDHSLPYPALPETGTAAPSASSKDGNADDDMPGGGHEMYVGMYKTALEMIEDERFQEMDAK